MRFPRGAQTRDPDPTIAPPAGGCQTGERETRHGRRPTGATGVPRVAAAPARGTDALRRGTTRRLAGARAHRM